VGLVGQFSLSSDVLPGGMRDSGYVAKRLAKGTAPTREPVVARTAAI
jgi:hypothetical protein